jgi:diguanylate cyclase (GGDEF)-like protein/PAS domain S-box-containing protein
MVLLTGIALAVIFSVTGYCLSRQIDWHFDTALANASLLHDARIARNAVPERHERVLQHNIYINTEMQHMLNENRKAVLATTVYAFTASYFVALLCILFLLRLSRRQWKRRLALSVAEAGKVLQHNTLLLNTTTDGICSVDNNGNITSMNRAALTMHGCALEEAMGKNLHDLFHHHYPDGRVHPAANCPLTQTLDDGEVHQSEVWLFRRNGSFFPARMRVTPIYERGQKTGAIVIFCDTTEQRNRQEALLRLATTDSLTGASNRRHFFDQLETELARQRRHGGFVSLLMTDLDFFKCVNDDHGHAAGDAVLNHFVHTAQQTMRRSDVIGRIGGEEFAILLPGDGIYGAREVAERLRRTFETSPTRIGNTLMRVTVSIGITELLSTDVGAEEPLRRADEALYAAKAAGRNCSVLYDPAWQRNIAQKTATNEADASAQPRQSLQGLAAPEHGQDGVDGGGVLHTEQDDP